eukprot:scaffold226686_cov19-Tisochrysis_lutea.AAC.1
MGVTSENVASKFGIDRKTQDAFSVRSHQKAAAARAAGKFKDEIVPVHTKVGWSPCVLCGFACACLEDRVVIVLWAWFCLGTPRWARGHVYGWAMTSVVEFSVGGRREHAL